LIADVLFNTNTHTFKKTDEKSDNLNEVNYKKVDKNNLFKELRE